MGTTLRLHGLLNLMDRWDRLPALLERLCRGETTAVALAEGAKPYLLAALQQRLGVPILVVTARPGQARELQEQIAVWSVEPERVLLFPEPDSLPHERMPEDPAAIAARLTAMSALLQGGGDGGMGGRGDGGASSLITHHSSLITPPVVVASGRAMMEPLMAPEQLQRSTIRLRAGQRISLQATLKRWVELGYEPAAVVEVPGSFSRRGGILDIYPPASPVPFRIELFGDEIESIRTFDPATQRSTARVGELLVTPPSEKAPEQAPGPGKQAQGDTGTRGRGARESSLLAYLPEGGLLVLDDPAQIAAVCSDLLEQSVHLRMQAAERGETAADLPFHILEWEKTRWEIGRGRWPVMEMRYDPDAEELPFAAPPSFGGKVKPLLDEVLGLASGAAAPDMKPTPRTVALVSQQSRRLAELLAERNYPITPVDAVERAPLPGLHLVHGSLSHGWSSDELGAVVLGDAEIFGWSKARRAVRRRTMPRESFLSDLAEGDLAVHIEHGIGRFRGLQRMLTEGREREYLVLEYAEGDRLYVPVDQVDRVARYVGAGEESPALSRLGTSDWARAKERVKNSVRNVATELLKVYSARQAQPGYAFSPDTPWQGELEASFPYMETPDQLQAISEVKADMEAARPMDRLICGDVGYGKTEVALRAAFKAVMDGKQVAVLVPTTVLAQQHYDTFRTRLQAFPVNIEMLSRFRSEREQRQVVEGLRTGVVDICIGTHRLVQKDVEFKDLGLVIVDEEQRFGVMHKERLKQLRQQVDVLTLSATPIPRTLHMSLAGIRDMSTMETPPEDRLPIRTFVAEYSDAMVREAVLREMDRGGQVYFVHNRVQSIQFVASHLQRLVPEARIVVGHGQMPEDVLERVMLEFADGQHDILVCTTIIESGLDIPNVNTLVVNHADRFGLAQLYQLRGRVGRGANRAYAYFLYARNRQLTETAERRLKTIFENTELGSGFRIAMKDLEIRGAGNLLGVEQHGHVNAVGFDLYTRLLSEAVSELRGQPVKVEREVSVDLPLQAHLPAEYVTDEAARLSLYQRLAAVKREGDLGEMVEEVQDRFGPLPVEAQNLFYLVNVKLVAAELGISSVSTVEDEIVIKLDGTPLTLRNRLQRQYGPKIRVLSNQIRLQRGRGDGWLLVLQQILEEVREAAEAAPARP